MSTNSSFSSGSVCRTTAVTSPEMAEVDPVKHNTEGRDGQSAVGNGNGGGRDALPTPPLTAAFSSALRFIPTSVVSRPATVKDESRSRSNTIQPEPVKTPMIATDQASSTPSLPPL